MVGHLVLVQVIGVQIPVLEPELKKPVITGFLIVN